MSEAKRAKAQSVGTLGIRVKRAGSDDWEDHGVHPIYAEEVPNLKHADPVAKPEET